MQVTVEGVPNQLYTQGMLPHHHWEEIVKEFAPEDAYRSSTNMFTTYFRSQYALWLDFRSSDDRKLHGSGRRVENASEGITLQLEKTVQPAGAINCYIYLLMDAQLNIDGGRFKDVIY